MRDVEQATFIPLIFSTTGGMGNPARTFYKRLACLAPKRKRQYPLQWSWFNVNWILHNCNLPSRGWSSHPPPTSGIFTSLDLKYSDFIRILLFGIIDLHFYTSVFLYICTDIIYNLYIYICFLFTPWYNYYIVIIILIIVIIIIIIIFFFYQQAKKMSIKI